jgi:glycosyltransferase involved in cell wall biosynthesis
MHIVLVSRLSGYGGVAVYNRTLARTLGQKEHRVTILTSRHSPDQPPAYEQDGVTFYRLLTQHRSWLHRLPVMGYYMRSILQYLYSHRVAHQLKTLEASSPPDVVEFAEVGGEGFVYLRRRQRRPVVIRCHTPTFVLRRYHLADEMPFDTRLTSAMEKYCVRHADALTAPSRDMAQTVAQACGIPTDQIRPIPNALDVEAFASNDRKQENPDTDEITILHVGRLERIKGVEVLARAIPLVLEQVPQARFVFIGAARSDEKALKWKKRLEECNRERVVLLGFLEKPEMIAWYHRADIAVVPSLNYESFSYTCAQAMAAGLPLVASRIGGIPETVDDGTSGILVQPNNVTELVRALVTLAHDSSLRRRMGEEGQHKARRCFDAPLVAEQMLQVYASVGENEA